MASSSIINSDMLIHVNSIGADVEARIHEDDAVVAAAEVTRSTMGRVMFDGLPGFDDDRLATISQLGRQQRQDTRNDYPSYVDVFRMIGDETRVRAVLLPSVPIPSLEAFKQIVAGLDEVTADQEDDPPEKDWIEFVARDALVNFRLDAAMVAVDHFTSDDTPYIPARTLHTALQIAGITPPFNWKDLDPNRSNALSATDLGTPLAHMFPFEVGRYRNDEEVGGQDFVEGEDVIDEYHDMALRVHYGLPFRLTDREPVIGYEQSS